MYEKHFCTKATACSKLMRESKRRCLIAANCSFGLRLFVENSSSPTKHDAGGSGVAMVVASVAVLVAVEEAEGGCFAVMKEEEAVVEDAEVVVEEAEAVVIVGAMVVVVSVVVFVLAGVSACFAFLCFLG